MVLGLPPRLKLRPVEDVEFTSRTAVVMGAGAGVGARAGGLVDDHAAGVERAAAGIRVDAGEGEGAAAVLDQTERSADAIANRAGEDVAAGVVDGERHRRRCAAVGNGTAAGEAA